MGENNFKPTEAGTFLILLYHGVYPDGLELGSRNSSGKHMSASEFRRQMEIVKEKWVPVSMWDIEAAYRGEKDWQVGAVAVTFDDGYRNVYETAWPILSELEIPFAWYLATGLVDRQEPTWTDKLEALIWSCHPYWSISLDGRQHGIHMETLDEDRVACFQAIKQRYKQLPMREVLVALEKVRSQVLPPHNCFDFPLYEMVTWEQVKRVSRSSLVSVGAHTVNHVPLARVPFDEAIREVQDSLLTVACHTYTYYPRILFSYPEGQEGDFDDACIPLIKVHSGVSICPTAIPGLNRVGETDPMRLYRCAPGLGGQPFPLD